MNIQIKHKIFILIILLSFTRLNAQTKNVKINVDWSDKQGMCSQCDYHSYDKKIIGSQLVDIELRGSFDVSYKIINIEYENTILHAMFSGLNISNNANVLIDFKKSRAVNYMVLNFNPLINNNGNLNRVKSIKIEIIYKQKLDNQDRENDFVANSVLKNGEWYKFGVNKTGVYKISKTFLTSIGIDVVNVNPNHINIYGNHQSELSIINSQERPDDLLKNSIFISGEADNVFNASDYILFYATGPQVEKERIGEGFNLSKNNYDSLSYYYLSIDPTTNSKRITNISNSSGISNFNSTSFQEVLLHENNYHNLLKSGDVWAGEEFDIEQEQTFNLLAQDVLRSKEVKLKTSVIVNALSGTRKFSVFVNNQLKSVIDGGLVIGGYTKGILNNSESSFNLTNEKVELKLNFEKSNPSSVGWLDYLQLNYTRINTNKNNQVVMRDWNSVEVGNITSFVISNPLINSLVWEVTDPANISKVITNKIGNNLQFVQATDSLRSFAVFSELQAFEPKFISKIENQNLHGLEQADYLIVKHHLFTKQADRLADLHRAKGLKVHVVDIQEVYNEFSSGMADPVAIRWIAKMFYDRGIGTNNQLESLLLFGDGSFDALNMIVGTDHSTNLLPTYQNPGPTKNDGVISLTSSFTSDDFFGILDDDESMSPNDLIDIGVGRFPVHTEEEATDIVNKIEHYMTFGSKLYNNANGVTCGDDGYASTLGDWRSRSLLIADDENGGAFVNDCESLSDTMNKKNREMNVVKIYLDAFQQEATSSGQRYPEVENAINQMINTGALVANYVGHGGELGLASERILSIPMMKTWTNIHKLPLFVSATCEFSRFDDAKRVSAGEEMLLLPYGGAIGLLTTTRLVYIGTNSFLIRNLYSNLYAEENNKNLSFGEIMRRTKNMTAGADNNYRNFTLLGDPALIIGKPAPFIQTKTINGKNINADIDTLKALGKVVIEAEIVDASGDLITNFNGVAYPTVYDKALTRFTLSQDTESPKIKFADRNSILYKGKSTVTNGKFSYSFVVPKDINYSYGKGKLSYYAENGNSQRLGYDSSIVVGGVDPNGINDKIGPTIELFMNDLNFVNGGVTDENPIFIAKVIDENGVNTTGNGIGHDITLIIDKQTASPIILNNYYEADLDTYQSGEVKYQLLELEEGVHSLTFKVWDVNNNSSEMSLDFEVKNKEEIAISHLLNYPNPFTTKTNFYFEHNQVCNSLDAKIEIYTVSGSLVKTIFETVHSSAFRSDGIFWDAKDDFGDKLARGVYVYKLSIEMETGEKAEKLEKLVIL